MVKDSKTLGLQSLCVCVGGGCVGGCVRVCFNDVALNRAVGVLCDAFCDGFAHGSASCSIPEKVDFKFTSQLFSVSEPRIGGTHWCKALEDIRYANLLPQYNFCAY